MREPWDTCVRDGQNGLETGLGGGRNRRADTSDLPEAAKSRHAACFIGIFSTTCYSFHAPEVDCISKGKTKTPHEFGVEVGVASTLKGNLIVRAKAFHGIQYDGHTLNEQLEQAAILKQDCQHKPTTVFVDLGYRGGDADNPDVHIMHRGKARRISEHERQLLKRRQAIEPIIGHLKSDHRLDRCHLKRETGDRLHAVLCAAGYNIRWLLRMIVKKGGAPLAADFFARVKDGARSAVQVCAHPLLAAWTRTPRSCRSAVTVVGGLRHARGR